MPCIGIQQAIEDALAKVAGAPVRIHASGRTDSGVHATRQVIHFDPPVQRTEKAWIFGANTNLPRDVAVRQPPWLTHPRWPAGQRPDEDQRSQPLDYYIDYNPPSLKQEEMGEEGAYNDGLNSGTTTPSKSANHTRRVPEEEWEIEEVAFEPRRRDNS